MPLQPRLKPLEGASRLSLGFFNSLINRIECTKPTAGTGVTITEEDNGFKISVALSNAVTLNVCSNGQPDTIEVYVKTATTA